MTTISVQLPFLVYRITSGSVVLVGMERPTKFAQVDLSKLTEVQKKIGLVSVDCLTGCDRGKLFGKSENETWEEFTIDLRPRFLEKTIGVELPQKVYRIKHNSPIKLFGIQRPTALAWVDVSKLTEAQKKTGFVSINCLTGLDRGKLFGKSENEIWEEFTINLESYTARINEIWAGLNAGIALDGRAREAERFF